MKKSLLKPEPHLANEHSDCCSLHCFIPPYVLDELAKSTDPKVRKEIVETIEETAKARATRSLLAELPVVAALPSDGTKQRLIYDMKNKPFPLPGVLARAENSPMTSDPAVNEAFDNSGITYDFYKNILNRNSIDDRGMPLISSVHFGSRFENAQWDGRQMMYGDGADRFLRFTRSLEVVAHELTHGVIQHTCNLVYQGQSGALNEHFADAFGIIIEQWHKNQPVNAPNVDWFIGGEIIQPIANVKGIRTFTADKAYINNPLFGTDPQPKHMRDIFTGNDDNGGVHFNSGIPNHAFYLIALKIGGNIWGTTAKIWYETMKSLHRDSQFQDAAENSYRIAGELFGQGSNEQLAVEEGWKGVGIHVASQANVIAKNITAPKPKLPKFFVKWDGLQLNKV
ncbi:peptidase [Dyadobacter endophyticus]|uniref:Neutral metalloproteinase n=1 Tax=Dyadobacter endophyticus TaxID=1749036 RepID=A0ABQ1YTJ2_9BACT|nr:M4 family metallopeptidase [Dyadobacter endophyticus]GGH36592.1 peptidase [Dyadobacter endophyticus]